MTSSGPFTAARAIALGTFVVGVIDGVDAVLLFWLRSGVPPARVFQGIASGLIGRSAAFAGGTPTALLGLLLHFVVACGIVTCYVVASRRIAALRRRPVLCGLAYGLVAYLAMNVVVVPLSMMGARAAFDTVSVVNGVLIHMLGVGVPAALVAARVSPHSGRPAVGVR